MPNTEKLAHWIRHDPDEKANEGFSRTWSWNVDGNKEHLLYLFKL